ncbi:MAG TPA: DUF5723 family protein, partial [Bacteroidales bacterium]|nr:DUF5723 family protein [Bacteroidales bacterium]
DRPDNLPRHAYIHGRLMGPSFMISVGNRHAFAFTNSVRTSTTVQNIPHNVAKFLLEGLEYPPQQNIRFTNDHGMNAGSLGWLEYGFTYAAKIAGRYDESFSAGITLKYLQAYHGGYLTASMIDYMTPHKDTLHIYLMNATGGFSIPLDRATNEFLGTEQPFRGSGFAFDLGFSYTRYLSAQSTRRMRRLCRYPYQPYRFKIGFALTDFGNIRFARQAQQLLFDNISADLYDVSSITYNNIDYFIDELALKLTASPDGLDGGNNFSMFLPSAISVQADYNFENRFFLGGVWIQHLPFAENHLSRPSYVSVIPRFETDHFEAAIPISLYRYNQLRAGAFLRYRYISVGTDNLAGFLGYTDFGGIDFYFAIHYGIFKGKCPDPFARDRDCDFFR